MKKLILLIIAYFCFVSVHAAYLKDVPKTLTQPDGSVLHCYASGDEFFNYLHDENGFTIMQHPHTGFYVYADKRDGQLVPTEFVAGRVDPASKNLRPFNLIFPQEWIGRRNIWKENEIHSINRDDLPNHGTLNNISIFIRFSDDEEFTNTYSSINDMFNDESQNAISMRTYFRAASYGAIEIPTYFYPGHNGETIISYQDTYPRSYFQPYNASTNPNGYLESERTGREFGLLERAVTYINTNYPVPTNLNIDYDNDGYVDNVCFIVRGDVGEWNALLWPHKWSLYDRYVYINGKRVGTFNFQLADASGYFNTSTMCHEMNHSLGAPDLYHYSYTGPSPVGIWDLMENNTTPPQHCGAYMKMKYGHWIDEIPEITQAGTYTLNPISSATPTNVAYKIQSDDPNQFYVLEYRDNTSLFETGLPGSGLLVYRIDTRFDGNASYDPSNGIYDEVYLFRPEGSFSGNGDLWTAHFSSNVGRTEFSSSTSAYPFFTDGTPDYNFRIYNITNAGSTISFTYGPSTVCSPPTNFVAFLEGNDVSLSWSAANNASSYNIYRNGSLIGNTTGTTYFDNNLAYGTYIYFLKSVDSNGLLSNASETVTVTIVPEGSIVIGSGESTNEYLPSYSYYNYSFTQQIYTANEIGGAGIISSIAFYNSGAEKTRTYDFYLKNTTKSSFSNTTDWVTVTDADKVFSGSVTMTADAWTIIPFDVTFDYDGVSNIVLVTDDNSGEWTGSPHMACNVFGAIGIQAIRVYGDYTNYDPTAPPTSYSNNEYSATLSVKNQLMIQKTDSGGGITPPSPALQVFAEYYPDANTPNSPYVKVHWGDLGFFDDFETGNFALFNWQFDETYLWSITSDNPYDGNYCMKSGGAGIANAVSSMSVTVNIPNDSEMSFFSKISSENNWDFGYFFMDGQQLASYTGNGSWGERVFPVTAGIHTFQWKYTKDGSVNSNNDCFYVDYIRFYNPIGFVYGFDDSALPAGWTTIDADGDGYGWYVASEIMSTGYGHNGSNDCVLSQSYYSGTILYPDNYLVSEQVTITYGLHFTFYACAQDANWATEHFGVFVSLGSNTNPDDFQEVQSWTMTAKGDEGRVIEGNASRDGNTRAQGTWYYYDVDLSAYAGVGYIAIRHYDCSDMFYLDVDDVAFGTVSSNRSTYCVYRALCDGSEIQLIADNVTENQYIDTEWTGLAYGYYKYGVCAVDGRGRIGEIHWNDEAIAENHHIIDASAFVRPTDSDGYLGEPSMANYDNGWLYYDNGSYATNVGTGGSTVYWGIMYPSNMLASYAGRNLSKVALFENSYNVDPITFSIYMGGTLSPGTLVYSDTFNPLGENAFHEIELSQSVPIDGTQNLWIIFSEYGTHPATSSNDSGDPNGRWISLDCSSWVDLADYELNYTWMIRGYLEENSYPELFWSDCLMKPYQQSISLNEGWNWFSTNVEITLNDLKAALVAALPGSTSITIKSKSNGRTTYNGTIWMGQLNTLDVAQMYRIYVSTDCEITLEGVPINPPITISPGANWIAFPLNQSMTLTNAFADFVVSGDVVKSKSNGIATYNGTTWRGALDTLVPGQGYIYNSSATGTKTFIFPVNTK